MEIFRALAALIEPPRAETARIAAALALGEPPTPSDYTEIFVFQLYPYLSVYLGAEGMLGGEARDRVAGFWRALGQTPPTDADHLSAMLALYARLAELEAEETDVARRASWRAARKAFLWEHLASWLHAYLWKLSEVGSPFYRAWGELLTKALRAEVEELGAQESLSVHLREVTEGIFDPRGGSDEREAVREFRQTLLSPARSGMILVRADFARAARELKLGLRLGERKFVLESLLSQDAFGVLDWLSREAARWVTVHAEAVAQLGAAAQVWMKRARAAQDMLDELKRTAKEVA